MSAPPSRSPIRRLSRGTIDRIAAGEVIERPASVVKELVENAIDAGARHVSVRILGGGIERIEVADDGAGIPAEELPLALERYATSKLDPDGALDAVATLGFRGEALASIAAVARLTLVSRPPGTESAEGIASVPGATPARLREGRSHGTTVTVEGLFATVPARRKFLKGPAAEQVEVTATIDRLHLAEPSVGLTFEANGAVVAEYPAAPDLKTAARQVLGDEFAGGAFPVRLERPGLTVDGWLGRPPLSRTSASGVYLSVNGRAVTARALSAAVRAAYIDYLPRSRYPIGVLRLTLDPARIDVNVHPAKREVKIEREGEVADELRRTIRAALIAGPQESARATRMVVSFPPIPFPDPGIRPLPGATSLAIGPALSRQTRLGPAASPREVAAGGRHPELWLLGSVADLYWVAASGEDLVLVDQHAASERAIYNELSATGRLARQELVQPFRLALTARQAQALSAHAEAVRASGFEVEPFGGGEWRVHSVPSYRGRRPAPEELAPLLEELADGGRPSVPDGLVERVTASIACHAAVRGGDPISAEEMGRILDTLYTTEAPALACPHGRPILYRVPRGRLDQWFGRSGT